MTEQQNGFDLSSVDQIAEAEDQGTIVHIHDVEERPMFYRDANGQEKPVTITVTGTQSRRYRSVEASIRRRKLKSRSLTGEALHADNIDRAAACTIAWEGILDHGQPVECNRQNAARLYKAAPWVLDQIAEAMNDHSRFFSNASTTP